ncbi:hypothetical protein PDJAM_G00207110 [Pangasius djambal]|uniref:Uncharacterized protein n=1 Tax=Pangasius djambal TaxID=1691987 RepID=A0ACC5Y9H1_9TELE|nr:hypothetical protein [Pangasius djambal]
MQDPNEDTEWNDILRKKGILPPKETPKEDEEEEQIIQQQSIVKTYENMTLEELEENEDEFSEEDEIAIEMYSACVWFDCPSCFQSGLRSLILLCSSELEWRLSESGAVKTDLEENPRKQIQDQLISSIRCSAPSRKDSDESDDD